MTAQPKKLHILRRQSFFYEARERFLFADWTNLTWDRLPYPSTDLIDFTRTLRKLPYPSQHFDAVYVNRFLEYLDEEEFDEFLSEVCRVIRPGARIRIACSDLEQIAEEYLSLLTRARETKDLEDVRRYRWSMLALLDPLFREQRGGAICKLLESGDFDCKQVKRTTGDLYLTFLSKGTGLQKSSRLKKFRRMTVDELLFWAARQLIKMSLRRRTTVDVDKVFRYYDFESLVTRLKPYGFTQIKRLSYNDSQLAAWSRYQFDTSPFGDYAYAPGMYVEAIWTPVDSIKLSEGRRAIIQSPLARPEATI